MGTYEYPDANSIPDLDRLDFFLQLGEGFPTESFVTQLGVVNLIWISRSGSPIQELTYQQLSDLYQGSESGQTGSLPDSVSKIELWLYPKETVLTDFLSTEFHISNRVAAAAYLAPDPGAMLQAVSENSNALGYVPESWLKQYSSDLNIQIIQILSTPSDNFNPRVPVFAVASTEPEALGRQALACLKDQLNQLP